MDQNLQSAYEGLQRTVDSQESLIDTLKKQNTKLQSDNKKMKDQISDLQKKVGGGGGGVDSGPSAMSAKAALAAKLGAKPPGGGVDSGPSAMSAKAALAAKLGAKKPGGVSGGMSRAGAAAALGGLLKKPGAGGGPSKPANSESDELAPASAGAEPDMNRIFKKYEMMLKLGISIHGAVGRMVQDGIDKDIVRAFKAKHAEALGETKEDEIDLEELGLKEPRKIKIGGGMKMKRLHWDPVHPTRVPQTIWKSVDDNTVRYNAQHFELNFQIRARKPKPETKGGAKKTAGAKGEIKTFVPKKRLQGVLIGLKSLGLDNDQLRSVLHNMDEKVMTQERLLKLMDIAPSQDEQTEAEKEVVQNGNGDPSQFDKVEQFFYSLCDFYRLEERLRMWLFKMQFQEIQQSLLTQYKIVQRTCDKVKNNKHLRKLLTIILAFGNHMNAGTAKGGAFGYQLKVLNMLPSVKTFDNAKSLMMYIYEFCDKNYPDTLEVVAELGPLLKRSSTMETDVLNKAYERMRESMKQIQDLVESDEIENYDMDDCFCQQMEVFYKKARPSVNKFKMTVSNVEARTKRLMKQFDFGDDDHPEVIEQLFKLLHSFVTDIDSAKDGLVKLEKERQKKIMKKKRLAKKKKAAAARKARNQEPDDEEEKEEERVKGSALQEAARAKLLFEEELNKTKTKLQGHVRERSSFVRTGGTLSATQTQSDTLRRISSMYQNNVEQSRAIEEAKRKAEVARYNKFVLPPIAGGNKHTGRYGPTTPKQNIIVTQQNTDLPDDNSGVMAPPSRARGNGPERRSQPGPITKSQPPQQPRQLSTANGSSARILSPRAQQQVQRPQTQSSPRGSPRGGPSQPLRPPPQMQQQARSGPPPYTGPNQQQQTQQRHNSYQTPTQQQPPPPHNPPPVNLFEKNSVTASKESSKRGGSSRRMINPKTGPLPPVPDNPLPAAPNNGSNLSINSNDGRKKKKKDKKGGHSSTDIRSKSDKKRDKKKNKAAASVDVRRNKHQPPRSPQSGPAMTPEQQAYQQQQQQQAVAYQQQQIQAWYAMPPQQQKQAWEKMSPQQQQAWQQQLQAYQQQYQQQQQQQQAWNQLTPQQQQAYYQQPQQQQAATYQNRR